MTMLKILQYSTKKKLKYFLVLHVFLVESFYSFLTIFIDFINNSIIVFFFGQTNLTVLLKLLFIIHPVDNVLL